MVEVDAGRQEVVERRTAGGHGTLAIRSADATRTARTADVIGSERHGEVEPAEGRREVHDLRAAGFETEAGAGAGDGRRHIGAERSAYLPTARIAERLIRAVQAEV